MADYSYIGSGKIYLRDTSAALGLLEVGNCSALDFGITEDVKELKDFTQPGGGTYNEVRRISAVEAKISAHDLSPTNLQRAVYGVNTTVTSALVTDEIHVDVQPGSFVATDFLPNAAGITTVKVAAVTKTAGVDYEARPGGIFIIVGGTIAALDDVLITYTKAASDVVQALVTSGKEYEIVFDGLNEARTGKKTRITAHRCKLGAAANMSFIGEDYAVLEMTGKLLKDTTKNGTSVSQYFKVEIQQ